MTLTCGSLLRFRAHQPNPLIPRKMIHGVIDSTGALEMADIPEKVSTAGGGITVWKWVQSIAPRLEN